MRSARYALLAGIVALAGFLTISAQKPSDPAAGCLRCHEMKFTTDQWRVSTHRTIDCKTCHGGTLQMSNVVKLAKHVTGETPDKLRMKHAHVQPSVEACKTCHQQQFAEWRSGPHGITYSKIFLDSKHNRERPLMDDCLRCHGMHFEGGIRDLIEPLDAKGPWKLKYTEAANDPAIPCLACHSVHQHGELAENRQVRAKEKVRPSLALYDRRDMQHIKAAALPIPAMMDGARAVKMSPDPRQALCYQCHAAEATMQVKSGDDRTPMGVHEGLSCLACHQKHGQDTQASCASCHPRLSNCGLDVEKMDTTFANPKSKHNIHWVKCADCHPKGVPQKRSLRAGVKPGDESDTGGTD
jgi:hypothetical protein